MESIASSSRPITYRDVFHNGNWIRLWTGQTISQLGDAISDVAFPLLVYDVTRSAVGLGLSLAIELAPLIVIGPVAGVFADRWNRRTLLLLMDAARVLCALGIFVSSSIWQLYLLALLAAIMQATFLPTYSAVIPQITEGQFSKSIGLSYMGYQAMQVIGPMAAAVLIGLAHGPRAAFLFDAATFAAGFLLTLTIKVGEAPRQGQGCGVFADLRAGAILLWNNAVVRYVVSYNALMDLTAATATLGAVIYIKEALRLPGAAGDQLFGVTGAVLAGSFAVVTWLIGVADHRAPKRLLILWGPVLAGLAYLAFCLHPGPRAILPLFVVASAGTACSLVPVMAYLGVAVPVDRRARIYSLTNALGALARLASYSICGVAAVRLPPEGLLLISGGLLLVGTPLCTLALQGSRALREYDEAQR